MTQMTFLRSAAVQFLELPGELREEAEVMLDHFSGQFRNKIRPEGYFQYCRSRGHRTVRIVFSVDDGEITVVEIGVE